MSQTLASQKPSGLRASGVVKSFGERRVLDGVGFEALRGEIVAILGESGCGKSTLLRLIAGLESPDTGRVEIEGPISVVFQDARLLPWLRVWENVTFGLSCAREEGRRKALNVLEEVGLSSLWGAWPGTLSGGEAQRAALARSLVREPAALLLDEPFGALDALTRLRMHALLESVWRRRRFTAVLVTHDVDEALSLSDRVLVLGQAQVLADFEVTLARPRRRQDAEFIRLRDRLLALLGAPTN